MRIVVTGATGNVGTSIVSVLGEDPQITSIVGVARRLPSWEPPKTTWVRADVTSRDLTTLFQGADAVVHLAWIFQPTRDELATWRNNVLGALRVFQAVARAGVPCLVHASSVGTYSPGPQHRPVDESWPTHALAHAAYGREKSYLERVLDTFERDHPGIRVVRMRPAFTFKRESASQQRRLFAGPLLPGSLVAPRFIPVVPQTPGLRLQALHSMDAAEAYRLALVSDVRGAFNLAAEPVVDAATLGRLLDARPVRVPRAVLRAAVAAAWRLRLVPASPTLLDLALSLPAMSTDRAHAELGWKPQRTATETLTEFFEGLRDGAGMDTPPLSPRAGGILRIRELASGVGSRP
jgi:nucleoside-diphosphate-sugar epimerase